MATEPFAPPFQHPDLPGIGGRIGPNPEDFQVDEIPLYAASGEGQHHYVRVRKRCLTSDRVSTEIARAAGVSAHEIGSAGMKDKHAVTTQWFSVPATAPVEPDKWQLPEGIELLEVSRHDNKLRTGHLLGNRFRIRLVDVDTDGLEAKTRRLCSALTQSRLQNYFGAQRFGFAGQNLERALSWARAGARGGKRFEKKLYPSVLQSEVFNRYVELRAAAGFEQLLSGEIVRLDNSGAHFVVEDVEKETPRYEQGDLWLTGPMFGPKARAAADVALELELRAQAQVGIDEDVRRAIGKLGPGTRRDLFVPLDDLEAIFEETGSVVLSFGLPSGSYATEVMRQFTREPFLAVRERAPMS
jgi:tRNA pseudouridine13 synthase